LLEGIDVFHEEKEGLAGENVKARSAVGAGADRHVGDYQRCAWGDERADIIFEAGREAHSISEAFQIRHPAAATGRRNPLASPTSLHPGKVGHSSKGLIKINLKLIAAHAVIGSDQPLLEIPNGAVCQRQHRPHFGSRLTLKPPKYPYGATPEPFKLVLPAIAVPMENGSDILSHGSARDGIAP
jgi:hypothetical protein